VPGTQVAPSSPARVTQCFAPGFDRLVPLGPSSPGPARRVRKALWGATCWQDGHRFHWPTASSGRRTGARIGLNITTGCTVRQTGH
jgi:hypothetical protein